MGSLFLNPWMLALAGLAGGIVLLYILKLRRQKVRISSTLLWERSVQDFKANAPWQRLRPNILMILQVLAVLLLALALARPFIFGTATLGAQTVLVIDTSASMLAKDESPDRLGRAIDAAGEVIGGLSRRDEAMVVAAGPVPRLLASFTNDKGELRAAVRRAREGAGGVADLDTALGLVASVVAGSEATVIVFSDGAVPALNPAALAGSDGESAMNLSYFAVGTQSGNLGIIEAGTQLNRITGEYELFAAVQNYYGEQRTVDVLLSVGDELSDVRELTIEPGGRAELVLENLAYLSDPISIELDINDELLEDNTAWVIMPPRQRHKVALATTGESPLLRRVLSSLPDIDYYSYEGGQLSGEAPLGDDGIDVWVVEGDAAAPANAEDSYLFINATSHSYLPVIPGGRAELDFSADPPVIPTVVAYERGHSLLRYVNIAELRLEAIRRTQVHPYGRVIVESSEGPLVVEGNLQGQRSVYLAFDIYESDFPLRAAFPIFMSNAIRQLGEAASGSVAGVSAAGERIDLTAPQQASSVMISYPDGESETMQLEGRGYTLASTTQTGLYGLAYFDENNDPLRSLIMPVSLIDDEESAISPADNLHISGSDGTLASGALPSEIEGRRDVKTNREFFLWILLAVLLILCLEWYIYHTRSL